MTRYMLPYFPPAKLSAIRKRWLKEMTERRAEVMQLTATERAAIERITDPWDWPQITQFGGPDANHYPPPEAYSLANTYKIPSWYLCPWLTTEDGWNAYLKAFESLLPHAELYTAPCGEKGHLSTDDQILPPRKGHRE